MAPIKGRNRASDFDEFQQAASHDFDPEADDLPNDSSEDGEHSDGDGEDEADAREHYVKMDKSKLRQPKTAALGPQYRGSRISRDAALEEEDEDDPFGMGMEDEEDSEEDEIEALDGTGSSGEEEDGDESHAESADTSDTDFSDEDVNEQARPQLGSMLDQADKDALLGDMRRDQKDLASRLVQSNEIDAGKGRAVKKQRAGFDALLGTRIKLQKALIGVNTLVDEGQPAQTADAVERAEAAAFNLWSSLNNLREDLTAARTGDKRKRSRFTSDTTTEDIWKHMQEQEESSLPHRNATLQRWSRKARNDTVRPQTTLLGKADQQSSIIDNLQEHLSASNQDRLLKRAHTPRSCAPLQLSRKIPSDEKIYDDADFYGLLLKELLEQKSQDSVAASNIDLNFSLRREAKTRKDVDTKASKGRKLRYTVHEKLQNFMAPEDRRRWGERQTGELFGSLFGARLELGEEDGDLLMEDVEAADGEEALMLFRN